MPILTTETDFYPENLWDDPHAVACDTASKWWCLHTKPRQEKAVARDLQGAGVAFYLPQINNERRTPQGRKLKSVLPLFTGYLFLKGDDNDRMVAIHGNRVANVLQVFDQSTLEQDLRGIHKFLSSGLHVSTEPQVLPGTKVQIRSGPLAGAAGTVVRRGNGDHLVATVQFLSCGASVELRDWQIEPMVKR
ncbi:MAG: transcription termination/antitermination NusG family protein [Paludisphaera borealis]|uniref:transcription termination/antitermination protein NusG n=1 Tax=Paludisphaera borealis TaxID=1387353 RepID=UPI0028456A1D|nr:transcription termination/antitermination NusG family protein [Paludisphaera borealis]MDR3623139.1 transcription termination/antitermination NusG family protein [Paludisphaera borealis]